MKQELTERNQSITERYIQGDTLAVIAREFGISIARVHQIIRNKN